MKSKRAGGGECPNRPLPSYYTPYQGKDFVTEDGETYELVRTLVGDIAVGTEVMLENVGGQGE